MNAQELFDLGVEHRRNKRFGEAINAFRAAMDSADATEELIARCRASVELIQEINGFVNVDLLNP